MRNIRMRLIGRPVSVSETAAKWALRQEAGDLSDIDQRRLSDWLAADEAHLAAYESVLWSLGAVTRHAGSPEMLELRSAALAARSERPRRRPGWVGGLGVAAGLAAACGAWLALPQVGEGLVANNQAAVPASDPRSAVYRTGIGERSAIDLPDGSVAVLDTDSQLEVAYTGAARAVYLTKGQALFEVAHGKPLPFQVYAGGQRITAVGTTLNVRLENREVRVAMVEGIVRVRPIQSQAMATGQPIREVILSAGEALVAEPDRPLTVTAADTARIASWKDGRLVFNDTPLSVAVAEVNRYTTRTIAIADPSISGYRISGVFKTNDPEGFAQQITEIFPVDITASPDGSPTLRARTD